MKVAETISNTNSFWTFLIEVEILIDSSSVRPIQYCHSYNANCIPQTTNVITSGPHIPSLVNSGHKSCRPEIFKRISK